MSCLKRIEEVNPKVNALVEVLAEGALRAADASDRSVLKGEELGPLHGVPVATKINTDQAGHVTTDGVVAFQHNVATDDSPRSPTYAKQVLFSLEGAMSLHSA